MGKLLGRFYVTGCWPLSVDGLDLGYSERKTRWFPWHEKGIKAGQQFIRSLEPWDILQAMGVSEPTYHYTITQGKSL